ncbi:MAG: PorT family protein [Prevotellaceae bacterium]|jgi:hypothetical protein|nr:PorT family protein [Prevotellaceae bacterium]
MNNALKNRFHALQYYETSVSANDWEVISSRLQQRKRRKLIVVWFSAGAIAASVALFFLLHYPSPVEQPSVQAIVTTATTNNTPASSDIQVQMTTAEPIKNPYQAAKHLQKQPITNLRTKSPITTTNQHTENTDTIQIEKNIQIAVIIPIETIRDSTIEVAPPTLDSLFTFLLFNESRPDKQKNAQTWAIAFMAGQSTNFNTSFEGGERYLLPSNNGDLDIILLLKDAVNTRHYLPLSAGMTFRFYFAPRWAVESGLVYTYLASDYSLFNYAKIKQQLHYLGIPVNLVWQLIESKGFYFYASVGCMLEKGLVANYSYIDFQDESTRRKSIAGLQWSLNGQLGVGYNIYKRFGLYFEPVLRWFLPDNSQPVSVRSERTLCLGLNAGLRVNLK